MMLFEMFSWFDEDAPAFSVCFFLFCKVSHPGRFSQLKKADPRAKKQTSLLLTDQLITLATITSIRGKMTPPGYMIFYE